MDSKAQEVEEAAKRNELAGADPGLIGREGGGGGVQTLIQKRC